MSTPPSYTSRPRPGSVLFFLLPALLVMLGACGPSGYLLDPFADQDALELPDSTLAYTVYLIGDAGAPRRDGSEPSLALLERLLEDAGPRTGVVFLGDNIYPSGMPPPSSPERAEAERRLRAQIDAVRDFEGRVVFIPGNHDYGGAGLGGSRATLRRQERFVQNELEGGNTFLPDYGYPGPVEVPLTDNLTLVVLDTQWWFEDQRQYGDAGEFVVEHAAEVVLALEDILRRHEGRQVLVVGHHPIYSNGSHRGLYPSRNYTPVPLTRRYLGTPQDLSNRKYKTLRNALSEAFSKHDGLIYAAGHEHSLQYFKKGDQHYVVSGAGSKGGFAHGRGAAFVDEGDGLARLRYYTDGSVWLEFIGASEEDPEGRRLYARRIEDGTRPLVAYAPKQKAPKAEEPALLASTSMDVDGRELPGEAPEPTTDASPYRFAARDSVVRPASTRYRAGGLRRALLGDNYRDVWTTPVTMPVIDLRHTAGGLQPLKRGGGLQTSSLRLKGGDGDQYVLRSVDKNPAAAMPRAFRRTVAKDLLQDQISASHPYGAFVVPGLAEAGGIFHTAPRLVYVPNDTRLGLYQEDFADMVALFEMRPDEEQTDEPRFGKPENIIGFEKLFEELRADNDHRVDERAFARARLLDMLIGDVDRHKDQWRWAAYEPGELDPTLEGEARTQGKVYQPIPRDRDFAFFKIDGPMAFFVRIFGNRQLQRFDNQFGPGFGSLAALNSSGSTLDRRFTAGLTRADWLAEADSLRAGLTDEAIEAAVRQMPREAFALTGPYMIESLKARRDKLREAASEYYEMLARTVDVVGSDKQERFVIKRRLDGTTEVSAHKVTEEGEHVMVIYRRVFDPAETDEIRIYGMADEDTFVFEGEGRSDILVRAIGGEGHDVFLDASPGKTASANATFYDTDDGNAWDVSRRADVNRTDIRAYNRYEPLPLLYNEFGPTTSFAYNSDDGIFVGGGVEYVKQGYKKKPYAQYHKLFANYAYRTDAYNVGYVGHYPWLAGQWDGRLRAGAFVINDFSQFYGLGNETVNAEAVEDRFLAELRQVRVDPSLERNLPWFRRVGFGPYFQFTSVEPPAGGVSPNSGFSEEDFVDKYYAGAQAYFHLDGTDTLAATQSGARWLNRVSFNQGVRNSDDTFVRLSSEVSYFYTFDVPKPLTLALRVGGATNVGQFEFYQANTLGGETNLRGYPRTRFAGHSSLFTNAELRWTLLDFNAYFTRGDLGVLTFFDNGRVWARGENSSLWHQGYGGGVWINPFYRAVVTATLGFSGEDEGPLFDVSLGFLF